MEISNIKVEYHRNGSSGEGFHVTLFDYNDNGKQLKMVGVLFEEGGKCAVFDIDALSIGNIAFGRGNSWRGGDFEDQLREAIANWYKNS